MHDLNEKFKVSISIWKFLGVKKLLNSQKEKYVGNEISSIRHSRGCCILSFLIILELLVNRLLFKFFLFFKNLLLLFLLLLQLCSKCLRDMHTCVGKPIIYSEWTSSERRCDEGFLHWEKRRTTIGNVRR